jgi:hypothetical protein
MTSPFMFALILTLFLSPSQPPQQTPEKTSGSIIQDSVVVKKVLKAVRTHVLSVTKDRRRPLVVKEGKKSRRFIVVEFLTPVSRENNVYTAQVDADEFDHKIARILYVDVRASKGSYKVSRIRVGPNHFRKEDSSAK